MATILNIETSGKICSAALTCDGALEMQLDDSEGMKHAEKLAPFVQTLLGELKRKEQKLDAVAVSIGPGSYTGLRIGLSMAKGVAFGSNVPLIGVDTLKILAVKAMFRGNHWQGNEVLVPMIDARRMEVFTAAYDFALNDLMAPQAMILNEDSFADLLKDRSVWFMGDGSDKFKDVVKSDNAHFISGLTPQAKDMIALAEKAFREGDFLDVAYSVPQYLKAYQTTTPRSKI